MTPMGHRGGGAGDVRPLEGARVVVTRPREQAEALGALLRERGAEVLHVPTVAVADPQSWRELDMAIRKLAEGLYTWVVFTSANAVAKVFERLEAASLDARAFGRTRVAAVGPATAELLEGRGIRADFVPETFLGEALATGLGRGPGRVLIPRAKRAPRQILEVLRSAGWIPEQATAYVTTAADLTTPEAAAVRSGVFDIVTFTSGSTARAFAELVATPEDLQLGAADPPGRTVACLGPRAAEVARSAGFRVDVVAAEHTARGLVQALVDYRAATRS